MCAHYLIDKSRLLSTFFDKTFKWIVNVGRFSWKMWKTVTILLLILITITLVKCDLYASLSDLEDLVKTEEVFIKDLNDFVEKQEDVVEFLKK